MNPEHPSAPNDSDNSGESPGQDIAAQPPTPIPAAESPGGSRPFAPKSLNLLDYFSWVVIILVTLFIVVTTAMEQFGEHEPRKTTPSDLIQINLQAKVMVGQKVAEQMLRQGVSDADAQSNADAQLEGDNQATADRRPIPVALDSGTYQQRLCYAILLSELYGPQRALEYFAELDRKVADADFEPDEQQQAMRTSVEALLTDYSRGDFSGKGVSEQEQQRLREQLGYSGELLLTPAGSDDKPGRKWVENAGISAIAGTLTILIFGVLLFFFGIVAACVILGIVLGDKSPARFTPENQVGGIYLQTFAIWLAGFFGGQIGLQLAISASGIQLDAKFLIFVNVGVFFLSLSALAWPVVCGRRWSAVCHDIGWIGESFFKNVGIGIATYAAWLPAVLVAAFVVFVLMLSFPMSRDVGEFEVPASPGHPIQQLMASGDTTVWVGVFLAACVAAPIVEETMFRGVLYRHLRERSIAWQRWSSVAVSAIINGVIFAAIHPQGVLVIPLLTMLAIGFTLAREWRNSLVSSITMHAMNNSMVTMVMFLLL